MIGHARRLPARSQAADTPAARDQAAATPTARRRRAGDAPGEDAGGLDETGGRPAAAAAEATIEGVHARVAQDGGHLRVLDVEGARGGALGGALFRQFGDGLGAVVRMARVVAEQDFVQVVEVPVAFEAGLDAGGGNV
jgi:hypothetical protein